QTTGNPLYRRVTEETLGYAMREVTGPEGGFHSAQDADSEGEEGKFFVWTPQEIMAVLGEEDGRLACSYFGVTEEGNFEGANILYRPRPAEDVAREAGLPIPALEERMAQAKAKLLAARSRRVRPGLDDKVLTAWNGLMLGSFAEAACVLDRDEYQRAAVTCASFLLGTLLRDGRLLRSYRAGQAKGRGFLEDYACLIDGLINLHEATFDLRWLTEARTLAKHMLELFWDQRQEVFYDTGTDHESLIVRPRSFLDNAVPCGGSVAAGALLRLAILTGDESLARPAAASLRGVREAMARYPTSLGHWLSALDFYLSSPREVAVIGDIRLDATRRLRSVVARRYLPNRVLTGVAPGSAGAHDYPLLRERGLLNGQPTAYVCEGYACRAPVATPEDLEQQLGG
ncbi:MAG: thioredoxin domain-containing protein, partial [Chloroflexi bacterium]|nr:thioredoxin domain-containing protein [Chloroflexota bacterium]